jgi:protein-S-isoprenylcysteine O-methyltransferase Ste14
VSDTVENAAGAPGPARQSWVRAALTPFLMGAVLFSAAGRLDWFAAWIFIALVVLIQIRVIATLQRTSPDLLTERNRMRAGTKPWDKAIVPLIALVLPVLTWLAAGLDLRHARMTAIGPAAQAVGFLLAAGFAELTAWAMAVNRFFSGTVRIQTERGHRVVSTGPYSVVRHPGCVGMLGFTLSTPLALRSPLSFFPAGFCALLLVIRTVLEDRTLRAELEGYSEYALRVRWRLIPGIW